MRRLPVAALLFILVMGSAFAQSTTRASLKGQVLDPSGAVVPGAVVSIQPASGAAKSVTTDNLGHYSVVGLVPGNVNIIVKKPGFAIYTMQAFPVSGDGAMDIQLSVATESQEITVSDDRVHVEVDPESNGSALVLKGTDLDTLSDDPDDLQSDLQALAGPSAGPNGGQIYIDGFTGGTLPPKASIREIRINSNPFSAEYDKLGYGRIEIFTKPGMDKFRGQFMTSFNDNVFNAANPFLPNKPSFQSRFFTGNLAGPLSKKISFTFDVDRRDISQYGIVNALVVVDGNGNINPLTLTGPTTLSTEPYRAAIAAPTTRTSIVPRLDIALNDKNTLTMRYQWVYSTADNTGVGTFSLASLGANNADREHHFYITETAVLNTKMVTETRFNYAHETMENAPLSGLPQISVSDAFSTGGSTSGRSYTVDNYYEASNITTFTAGAHTLKWGARSRTDNFQSYAPSDFNGSFSFTGVTGSGAAQETSIQQYENTLLGTAGATPSEFNVAFGTPLSSVTQTDIGLFLTDDWRVRPTFTLSLGMRYETQTHLSGIGNFAPRIGWAWAVDGGAKKVAKTVIRGGVGFFYDRVADSLILNAERYNGITQQQYVVQNPTFFSTVMNNPSIVTPAWLASEGGIAQATSTNEIYSGLVAPRVFQSGLSVERQLPKNTVGTVTWAFTRGMHYLDSRNINAPIVQPDGSYVFPNANTDPVLLTESAGLFTQNQLIVNINSRMNKKVTLFGYYTYGKANGDADTGQGSLPSSPMNQYNLGAEWAPTRFDIRNRAFIGGSVTAPLKVMFSPFITFQTGGPFNITTGQQYYDDLVFNERPAFATGTLPANAIVKDTPYGNFVLNPQLGEQIIPRDFGRGPSQFTINMRVSRTWGLGKSKEVAGAAPMGGGPPGGGGGGRGGGPPGGGGYRGGGGGGPMGGMFGGGENTGKRFNLTLSAQARNLLNHENFGAPDSNLSSPLFGQYLGLAGGFGGGASVYNRRVDLQLRLTF
jgi:hypothetical protein